MDFFLCVPRTVSDSYDPYLSAERQMAELFQDDAPSKVNKLWPKSNKIETVAAASKKAAEPQTNIDQLEEDLKSILSEISQLGEVKEPPKRENTCIKPRANISRQIPKYCHACGSLYPDKHPVKFCCGCGVRRLYI